MTHSNSSLPGGRQGKAVIPEKNLPFGEENHIVLELKSFVKATATALLGVVLVLVLKEASVSHLGRGIMAIASVGNGRRPHPRLRPEAFEILARGNHQCFAVDAPEPS